MAPLPHCNDGNSGWHQLLLWCHVLFLSPLPFFPSLNASNTTLCIMLIQSYIWMLLWHQTWKLLSTGRGYIDAPNAMKHQIFGFYPANPCSVPCITSHNILSHLRFPAAGLQLWTLIRKCVASFKQIALKISFVSKPVKKMQSVMFKQCKNHQLSVDCVSM